jgi:PadR family transcriptional regulator, regulatory protein PadR
MCDEHQGGHDLDERGCRCGTRMRGSVQPWLLLLLRQKPSHGYELMERLGADEQAPDADPGLLYRTLRQLEQDGLVRSTWDTEGPGPARRLYELTPEGVEHLHAWAIDVRRNRQRLDRFLAEYEQLFQERR